jgi:uncharacterized protein
MLELSIYTLVFSANDKFYLYNSRSNFFSELTEDLYDVLISANFDALPNDVMAELRNREILVEASDKYDYYYSELMKFNARNNSRNTLSLVIAPTTACNFACPYCFESKKSPKTMSDEVIDKLAHFVNEYEGAKEVLITWYGGEPLIAFDKMRKIYEALSQEGMPKISQQSIVTNGYCFDDDVIAFFKEKGCSNIQITIDGLNDKHNRTRCLKNSPEPTFGRIINNICKIAAELTETPIHIRVNINKKNYKDFIEVYNFFKERFPGNKQIAVYPGIIREETPDKLTLCESSFRSSEIIEMHRLLREEGVDTSDFPSMRQKGCMMHHISGFIIGPEGEIYKCWNDVSNPDAVIGNIDSSDFSNLPRYVKYSIEAIPFNDECKDCIAFPICDGGCSYHRYRNMFENCNYDLCSPYKDKETLKKALLSKKLTN